MEHVLGHVAQGVGWGWEPYGENGSVTVCGGRAVNDSLRQVAFQRAQKGTGT